MHWEYMSVCEIPKLSLKTLSHIDVCLVDRISIKF